MNVKILVILAFLISFNVYSVAVTNSLKSSSGSIPFSGNNTLAHDYYIFCSGAFRFTSCALLRANSSGNNFYNANTSWPGPTGGWTCWVYKTSPCFSDIANVPFTISEGTSSVTINISGSPDSPTMTATTN